MEAPLRELRERILAAHHTRAPLRLRGAGSKDFFGETLTGEVLDTRAHAGIVAYEPSELVITARCGTPLSQIEAALTGAGQCLPFEPPRFGGDPTIGGVIAAGLSGPRRAYAGAARDFVLGASLLAASGELLHFGGQVMKNVAGFDVSRLLCGSLGVLGLIAEISLKVLPQPRAETTLQFEWSAAQALAQFQRWRAQPLPISATAWQAGVARVRLSGAPSALRAASAKLGGETLDTEAARRWWCALRDQTLPLAGAASQRVWRLSLPATAALDTGGAAIMLIEWSGALRWLHSDASADVVRAAAAKAGGSATLWRGTRDAPMFHPLNAAVLELHRRLKREFDPHDIFNRDRLHTQL